MKRTSILFLIYLIAGIPGLFYGQNYLDVPPDPNFSQDYLNNVIYGDTTESGERIPDRVYRLQIGGIYYFNNTIKTDGWDLKIVAEGEPTAEFSKAIILTGVNDQGKTPPFFAEVHGDVLFKNLYFSLLSTKNKQVRNLVNVYKDNAHIEMENCFVEWAKAFAFARVYSSYVTARLTDSYFRNVSSVGGPYNGKIFKFEDNPVKEIFVQNCTFANIQGPLISVHYNTVEKFVFDHNTVVNTIIKPFQFDYWTEGLVTNNIFFNSASYGNSVTDQTDAEPSGFINVYDIPDSMLSQVNLPSENDRRLEVRNNVYFFDQKVEAYLAKWAELDSVQKVRWMNDSTLSFVNDDVNFPNLNVEDPLMEDVGFFEYPTPDSMIKKMDQWRTDGKKTTWWWVDDDGDKIGNATDRPHDLSYPTSSIAYTAADNGFPLGDLNWFPDKKAEWQATAIDDQNWQVAGQFTLEQNYPNPFNPLTRIDFSLPGSAEVKIKVFNVLGQKVRTLVNARMKAGQHHVLWDGRDETGRMLPAGVYFYRLELEGARMTRKMILMK